MVQIRAVGYIRVSTTRQMTSGFSVPQQNLEIRTYTATHNMVLVSVYTDDQTGTNMSRAGLDSALTDLQELRADALVICESDRLSRNAADYMYIREELRNIGAQLHSTRRGWINLEDFGSQIVEDVYGRMAQVERDRIVERMRLGKVSKARQGKIVNPHFLPYGYAVNDDVIIIVKEESQIVCEIFEMYLGGLPIKAVAAQLTARKIPTYYDTRSSEKWNVKRDNYGAWHDSTVRRVLGNRAYIGEWQYNAREGNIPLPLPPIIDRESFNLVQMRLKENKRKASRNTKREYLAQGRITCTCGKTMRARYSTGPKKKYPYYVCTKECKNLQAKTVDGILWEWVKRLLMEPEYLTELVDKYLESQVDQQDNITSSLNGIRGNIEQNKERQKRLAQSFIEGNIDDDVLVEMGASLRQEKQDLLDQEAAEVSRLGTMAEVRNNASELLRLMSTVQDGLRFYDDEPFDIRKNWVDALGAEIEIQPGSEHARFICFIGSDILSIVSTVSRYDNHNWQIEFTAVLPIMTVRNYAHTD